MATSCGISGCGTGGWAGPLPGDPSEVFGLTATAQYGGIQLRWNLPLVNGFALAYVRLFRSFDINFSNAVELPPQAGTAYFDQTQPGEPLRTKYYWVRQMSINGTEGELVGPAFATALPFIQQMLELLTDQIDNGKLAPLLRTEIEKIPLLVLDLAGETQARLDDNAALQLVLDTVQTDLGLAQTLIASETTNRTTAVSAVVGELNVLGAGVAGNAAAIVAEQTARVTALEALASDVTTLYAESASNSAAIIAEQTTRVNEIEALATSIEELVAAGGGETSAGLLAEATTRAAADSALASDITALQARTTTAEADIVSANSARVTGDEANASSITTLQSLTNTKGKVIFGSSAPSVGDQLPQNLWIDTTGGSNTPKRWDGTAWLVMTDKTASDALAGVASTSAVLSSNYYTRSQVDSAVAGAQTTAQTYADGRVASAQTTLQTNINTANGKITDIGARYTAVVDVDGLVGGFGVYNNGQFVEAGFNVDTFWVGRTANKVKPFVLTGGVVYINEAAIGQLSANAVDTRGLTVRDLSGNIILGAGTPLQMNYVPGGALNSNISLSPDGTLNGGGGGQVTRQPVLDLGGGTTVFGQRGRNDAPSEYSVGRTLQFKESSALGLTGTAFYCTLETVKQYVDGSGGGIIQYAYSNDKTYRRTLADPAAASWSGSTWALDLDRNSYTGDLNATLGANWESNLTGRPTELTDGRVTTAINNQGVLISRAAPGALAAPVATGLHLGSDFMGYWNSSTGWRTYMDNSGNFYLGGTGGAFKWESSIAKLTVGNPTGARITFDTSTGELEMVIKSSKISYLGIVDNMPQKTIFDDRFYETVNVTAVARAIFTTDGRIQSQISNPSTPATISNWYGPTTSGIGGSGSPAYWVRCRYTGAAPAGSAVNTWLGMNAERNWSVSATATALSQTINVQTDLTIDLSNSATGIPIIATYKIRLDVIATGAG